MDARTPDDPAVPARPGRATRPVLGPPVPQRLLSPGFLSAVIVRTRWEHLQRQERADKTAGAFRERVGTLPHGLHLR